MFPPSACVAVDGVFNGVIVVEVVHRRRPEGRLLERWRLEGQGVFVFTHQRPTRAATSGLSCAQIQGHDKCRHQLWARGIDDRAPEAIGPIG